MAVAVSTAIGISNPDYVLDLLRSGSQIMDVGIFKLCEKLRDKMLEMEGTGNEIARLIQMAVDYMVKAGRDGEVFNMAELHDMNVELAMLMKNATADNLKNFARVQFSIGQLIMGSREVTCDTLCDIALMLCKTIESKGYEELAELISLYNQTTKIVRKSPYYVDMSDMEYLYKFYSWHFHSIRPFLLENEKNITELLETIVDVLPNNGNLSMASILNLNQKMCQTIESVLSPATETALEKLCQANLKLASLMVVYPNKVAIQSGLLQINRLIIQQLIKEDEGKATSFDIMLLVSLANLMMKFFDNISKALLAKVLFGNGTNGISKSIGWEPYPNQKNCIAKCSVKSVLVPDAIPEEDDADSDATVTLQSVSEPLTSSQELHSATLTSLPRQKE